jgi:hypothetical protein
MCQQLYRKIIVMPRAKAYRTLWRKDHYPKQTKPQRHLFTGAVTSEPKSFSQGLIKNHCLPPETETKKASASNRWLIENRCLGTKESPSGLYRTNHTHKPCASKQRSRERS